MKQKEILENLTGEKFPEPTQQEYYRQQLEGTPYWIIQDKTGYNLIMGKYRLNNIPIETWLQMEEWIDKNHWNITLSTIICVVTDMLKQQQTSLQQTLNTLENLTDKDKKTILNHNN